LLEAGGFPHGPVIGKLWPRREKTYLVAGLEPSSSEGHPALRVVAFDLSGPSVRRLASGAGPFPLGRDDELAGFDLAAYRLTTKEYAFGVHCSRKPRLRRRLRHLDSIVFFRPERQSHPRNPAHLDVIRRRSGRRMERGRHA
jgi:hypothetical protein